MITPQTLTPQQVGVIKVGAARRYRQRNVRPETADYLFNRWVHKRAVTAGIVQPQPPAQPSERVLKLAEAIRPLAVKARAARSA